MSMEFIKTKDDILTNIIIRSDYTLTETQVDQVCQAVEKILS